MSVASVKSQFSEVLALRQHVLNEASHRHLQEAARAWQRHGKKAEPILKRLYRMRAAKSLREFHDYTTKPCGCYRDPGGHP